MYIPATIRAAPNDSRAWTVGGGIAASRGHFRTRATRCLSSKVHLLGTTRGRHRIVTLHLAKISYMYVVVYMQNSVAAVKNRHRLRDLVHADLSVTRRTAVFRSGSLLMTLRRGGVAAGICVRISGSHAAFLFRLTC